MAKKRTLTTRVPTIPALPQRASGLELHELEDGYIVYGKRGESLLHLNATAAVVFELCTGLNSTKEIVALVQAAYGLRRRPDAEVEQCLFQMLDAGLLESGTKTSTARKVVGSSSPAKRRPKLKSPSKKPKRRKPRV